MQHSSIKTLGTDLQLGSVVLALCQAGVGGEQTHGELLETVCGSTANMAYENLIWKT